MQDPNRDVLNRANSNNRNSSSENNFPSNSDQEFSGDESFLNDVPVLDNNYSRTTVFEEENESHEEGYFNDVNYLRVPPSLSISIKRENTSWLGTPIKEEFQKPFALQVLSAPPPALCLQTNNKRAFSDLYPVKPLPTPSSLKPESTINTMQPSVTKLPENRVISSITDKAVPTQSKSKKNRPTVTIEMLEPELNELLRIQEAYRTPAQKQKIKTLRSNITRIKNKNLLADLSEPTNQIRNLSIQNQELRESIAKNKEQYERTIKENEIKYQRIIDELNSKYSALELQCFDLKEKYRTEKKERKEIQQTYNVVTNQILCSSSKEAVPPNVPSFTSPKASRSNSGFFRPPSPTGPSSLENQLLSAAKPPFK